MSPEKKKQHKYTSDESTIDQEPLKLSLEDTVENKTTEENTQ